MAKSKSRAALSTLEHAAMRIVWERQPVSSEEVRGAIEHVHPLKASTVRTLLKRLEDKGYVTHEVAGRTYLYRALVKQSNVAVTAVRGIVEKFCAGSVENLLVGLVDDKQISAARLRELADQIALAESEQRAPSAEPKKRRKPRGPQ